MRICVYCKTKDTKLSNISFYKFPSDERILQCWLKNMGYSNWKPKNHVLCSQHFSTKCMDFNDRKFRLRKGSIPTIFNNKVVDSPINYRVIMDRNKKDLEKQNKNLKDSNISKPQTLEDCVRSANHDHTYLESIEQLKKNLIAEQTKNQIEKKKKIASMKKDVEHGIKSASHDHSYMQSVQQLKKNLSAAKVKIQQLSAKNYLLARKNMRSKKKIQSMQQMIRYLTKRSNLKNDSEVKLHPGCMYERREDYGNQDITQESKYEKKNKRSKDEVILMDTDFSEYESQTYTDNSEEEIDEEKIEIEVNNEILLKY